MLRDRQRSGRRGMVRRTRAEMEVTRATLLATARRVFGEHGYADASMDDLTARAGLTRGALYHHFGDKAGLLAAVVEQIDAEADARLAAVEAAADDAWQGFRDRCRAYLEMAREPEIQRIVLRDARAALGAPSHDAQRHCVASLERLLERLGGQGDLVRAPVPALARLVHGSLVEAACWIAEGDGREGGARLAAALAALDALLAGLRVPNAG
jgi:AcrR family transcriptional regulator